MLRLGLAIGAALAALGGPAAAATVAFNVSSECKVDCANVDLQLDALIVGRLTISTANFAPSGAIGRADLVDFFIGFGTTPATIIKDLTPGYAFSATWGADTSEISGVSFVAGGDDVLNDPGPFISVGPGGNTISLRGACRDVDCTSFSSTDTATINPLSLESTDHVTPVPLPATVWLLGAGMLAIAAVRRRRTPQNV